MDVIGAIGPASDLLPNNTVDGYQPVSRNGEVTQNAFIDGFQWNTVIDKTRGANAPEGAAERFDRARLAEEAQPAFHEWASVQPGFICVFQKNRSTRYRHHASAETATPVIACAQLLSDKNNSMYQFAGICRSKSIRDYDDVANGMKRDEFFTLHIGGPVTLLNNGSDAINQGDAVEWTFMDTRVTSTMPKRQKVGPRRIQVRKAKSSHRRVFGKALGYAKRGEPLDVLVGWASM
jgi:hypothetical protein